MFADAVRYAEEFSEGVPFRAVENCAEFAMRSFFKITAPHARAFRKHVGRRVFGGPYALPMTCERQPSREAARAADVRELSAFGAWPKKDP